MANEEEAFHGEDRYMRQNALNLAIALIQDREIPHRNAQNLIKEAEMLYAWITKGGCRKCAEKTSAES